MIAVNNFLTTFSCALKFPESKMPAMNENPVPPYAHLIRSCRVCGGRMSQSARTCPHCGDVLRTTPFFYDITVAIWLIIGVLLLLGGGCRILSEMGTNTLQ
jgi:hypothetical protein